MDKNDFEEIRKKAESGDAEAQFNLGLCYADGNGVAQDHVEAVSWYQKAAEQGDLGAIEVLRELQNTNRI